MNKITSIFIILIILISASCSSKKKEVKNAATEYKKAMKILKDRRYFEAATKFEELSDEYPLSEWSIKGQAIAAYAFFAEENYTEVIRVASEFKTLYPGNHYMPYIQYMKALSHFNLMPNVKRGQDDTKMSSSDFRELIARFPRSKYIKDAKDKLIKIDENLAGSIMSSARYQMNNQNYIGAIMNFNKVIYRYARTNQAQEAYVRLYEIYYKLGIANMVKETKDEMLKNYQDGYWVRYIKKITNNKK
ncbi:outer membrane protein assembly factor BamD [Rickettsiales bacterium]|nr:outer membrane protein assembly factor BamD [Rickettsiales bacterium]